MEKIYFKVNKQTLVGTKITELIEKARLIEKEITQYVSSLGSDYPYLVSSSYMCGTGIRAVKFDNEPDMKVWKFFDKKNFPSYYAPRNSGKDGKSIAEKFAQFENIDRNEINLIIGLERFLCRPGLDVSDNYYGITIFHDWQFAKTKDFEEITFTEYNNLFKN